MLLALTGCGRGAGHAPKSPSVASSETTQPTPASHSSAGPARPPFAVGIRTVTFIDRSRHVKVPGHGRQPRTLQTLIRYPANGPGRRTDVKNAAPARRAAPFPLIVFGHGYNITPTPYAPLLQAWARAGYVVAAPIFPLENADAPGGPNENDLVNQPQDMKFVISQMFALNGQNGGPFDGMIDPGRVAVSGQSDGGETALAVAYDKFFRDRRVDAAVILSGAKIPGISGFTFPAPSPPLLATQGSADVLNLPHYTHEFFDAAPAPKYLLTMFGASHLGPYTGQEQAGTLERVTVLFFDRYLKGLERDTLRLIKAGDVRGRSVVNASP